jgi:hypothetical protein
MTNKRKYQRFRNGQKKDAKNVYKKQKRKKLFSKINKFVKKNEFLLQYTTIPPTILALPFLLKNRW